MSAYIEKHGVRVNMKGMIVDEEGNEIAPFVPPPRLDTRDYNIVQTYYWYYDLKGKLKPRELIKPAPYHGMKRTYVREDIEEIPDENLVRSHLRFYIGDSPKAYTTITTKQFKRGILHGYGESWSEEQGLEDKVRPMVYLMLNGGWEQFKSRKKRKTIPTPKRKIKRVVKKIKRKKR